jgi:hypothetical protein
MNIASPFAGKAGNPFAWALGVSGVASILVFAALLRVFGVSLIAPAMGIAGAVLLWMAFRHPVTSLGVVLAWMPIHPLAFLLAKFFGPAYIGSFEGCDRVVLLVLVFILWMRNGVKFVAPDWFLLACLGLAVLRLAFGGTLLALLSDFNLVIAYAAGRVAVLTVSQERVWARRAVWIVAVLSVLGMTEVFVIGEGPRTVLYLSAAEGATDESALNAAFHADGFTGLRESATMFGPLQFAPLCMAALVIWWVYCRNPLSAAMITAGLICSVTRSAWLGTAVAIALLAVIMGQKRRFLLYATLALVLFITAIPVLGLGDYLLSTKTGQDLSAKGHQESIANGLEYVAGHPFGTGPGNAGMYAVKSDTEGVFIENTYLTLAAEYGILSSLCFIGFLFSALLVASRERGQLGCAAVGILAAFSLVMLVAPLHNVFSLASWIWFPIGLAVRFSNTHQDGACTRQEGSGAGY